LTASGGEDGHLVQVVGDSYLHICKRSHCSV
jgi:hypothetical protein